MSYKNVWRNYVVGVLLLNNVFWTHTINFCEGVYRRLRDILFIVSFIVSSIANTPTHVNTNFLCDELCAQ
jgi:hypothetical protein